MQERRRRRRRRRRIATVSRGVWRDGRGRDCLCSSSPIMKYVMSANTVLGRSLRGSRSVSSLAMKKADTR